jgi:hypothetical protein
MSIKPQKGQREAVFLFRHLPFCVLRRRGRISQRRTVEIKAARWSHCR